MCVYVLCMHLHIMSYSVLYCVKCMALAMLMGLVAMVILCGFISSLATCLCCCLTADNVVIYRDGRLQRKYVTSVDWFL